MGPSTASLTLAAPSTLRTCCNYWTALTRPWERQSQMSPPWFAEPVSLSPRPKCTSKPSTDSTFE